MTPFVPLFLLSFVLILLYKTGGQFNERLLLWQPSRIFLYSTVIIFVCFMLCWRIKYYDDSTNTILFSMILISGVREKVIYIFNV